MTRTRKRFPPRGTDWPTLQRALTDMKSGDIDWRGGRAPLFVFRNDDETWRVGRDAFMEYFTENALGRGRAFFSVGRMETEILDFGLDLLHAPEGGQGAMTSGGSESIFVAMKAARDAHRAARGVGRETALNLVMPVTGHPAFDKAAQAMDIEVRRAGLGEDRRADVTAMRALIDADTMALVGSAPCFPHGVVDPIDEIGALAQETGIWLHVDACVGGWILPFFEMNGRDVRRFDFRVPGVRSISADLHKFGFCPKPASTVFWRDGADMERATFFADAWPNGPFGTPTIAGTRPGGAVAGAWAVLNHLGVEGYREAAGRLAAMTDAWIARIGAMPELTLWARPDLSIVNFGSEAVDIFKVSEHMQARGWLPGLTRRPKGIHLMLSMFHEPVLDDYAADLEQCIALARADPAAPATLAADYGR